MAQTDPHERIKPQLLAIIPLGIEAERAFIASLTEQQRAEIGVGALESAHWSAKDHIAHMTAWQRLILDMLNAAASGAALPAPPDETQYNERTLAEQRTTDWATINAEVEQTHHAALAAVQACSEEALTADQERPLWARVFGNYYGHVIEHIANYYRANGETERALAVNRQSVATIGQAMGERSESYSFAVYNLACAYALAGQQDEAITTLGRALALNPSLTTWSQKDSDLVSLRAAPAYQALYTAE